MKTYDYADDPQSVEAQQIARAMALAQLMAQQGQSASPVYSNKAGVAKLIQSAMGGYQMQEAEKRQMALAERRQAAEKAEMGSILSGVEQGGQALPPLVRMLANSGNPQYRQMALAMALKSKEQAPEEFGTTPVAATDPATGKPVLVQLGKRGGRNVLPFVPQDKPDGPKRGALRERIQGEQMVQEEWDGEKWAPIGGGGRWNPKAGTTVNVNGPKEVFRNEKTLRDEFTEASKPYVKIRDAFTTVKGSLAGDITAPATLAAATKFMKMLDPESVVRESELQMALKSTGGLDRFLNLHNTIMKGGVLTPSQAQEIQRIAGTLYQAAEGQQKRASDYYTKLATDYQLDPSRIVRDLSPQDAPAKAAGPARIQSDADFEALPSGATFIGPDGKVRRKP
jgi:hypothetical protein